jgi:eukaryotic-like serine/threonine-protein kinase
MSSPVTVGDLLLRWEELRAEGRAVSAEELCPDRPDLLEELRRQIRALEAVYRVPRGAGLSAETLPGATLSADTRAAPPGYEVLGELGRGGMGVVYKARQVALNRLVALKVVLSGGHAGAQERARFKAEAEAAARLGHPNIVQVHEVGEHQGAPYLAMEYVDGESLDRKVDGTPQPPRQAAELVRTLARAVHYAHQRGVIHRDLKPANVLLAEGRTPKVADFGLAKRLDESGQTRTGDVLGTPSYMAPEQAEGRAHDVGPHTDVYALGAILYELLTGRPPLKGASVLETLEQVRTQEPVPPSQLAPKVPRDLEGVCLKCLEKEAGRRYPTAEELADDLDRFLGGESVRARSSGVVDQLARVLSRSHYDVQFHAWGTLLLWLAPLTLLAQVPVRALARAGRPLDAAVPAAGLWWGNRRGRKAAAGPAQRLLWSILFGNLLALALMAAVSLPPLGGPSDPLALYPRWAVLTGLAFFVMGGAYWGGCYLIGLSFFGLALLMPLAPEWAPLGLGGLLSAALALVGVRLRRLGREPGGGEHG